MKRTVFAAAAALLTLGCAHADDAAQEIEKKVELKVVVAGDGDAPSEVHWVSNDLELDDLAVGESRTITGESGTEVTVTRTDGGMEFDIGGEKVVVPDMGAHGTRMAFVDLEGDHDVDVEVMGVDGEEIDVRVIGGGAHVMQAHGSDGVTIISSEPLDDSVKESIRSVLISAGRDDEVVFIDGSEDGKQVKIVKKRVKRTL